MAHPAGDLRTLNDAPFGPEETSHEQEGYPLLVLESRATDDPQPPVPQQSLGPVTTAPAGQQPPYTAPGDERRQHALAPVAPRTGIDVGQPIPGGERILIHHVHETLSRAAQTAVTRKQNVGTAAAILIGKNDRRTRLTIQNNGTVTITVGMDDSVTAGGPSGFDIAAGASMDFHHRDWMWVVATAATTCQIVETIGEQSASQLADVAKNPTNVRAD